MQQSRSTADNLRNDLLNVSSEAATAVGLLSAVNKDANILCRLWIQFCSVTDLFARCECNRKYFQQRGHEKFQSIGKVVVLLKLKGTERGTAVKVAGRSSRGNT